MSVILFGYHNMGCRALKVLHELGIEVPAVFTHRDSPGENLWFDSLAEMARQYDITCHFPDNVNKPEWVELIRSLKPDVILSCYFRQMIKQDILDIPRLAAVNLHGSLLPKYRGRCPVNWQLVFGEKISGVTLHHMVIKADAGDIVAQKEVPVDFKDNALTLFHKLEDAAEEVLREYIPRLLDNTAPRIKQDHSKASYFGGRRPEDGLIDWNWDAVRIYNLVRAVTWPYPGSFGFVQENGRKIYIWECEPLEDMDTGKAPGTVAIRDGNCLVQSGKGCIRIISATDSPQPMAAKGITPGLLEDGSRLVTGPMIS